MNQSQNSTSTTDSDPREKVKDCCRKLIAFMCTQVGVGGLIVSYAIFGAFSFISVETQEENFEVIFVNNLHNETALKLWNILVEYNTFDQIVTKTKIDNLLINLQNNLVQAHKRGYDGRSVHEIWNFPAALMFSLSVFTMIGYGNMVPRTDWGKVLTMLYAVFGIPLYILYFMNMGKILADTFRWFYTYLYNCARERSKNPEGHRVIVPSTACLWVMGVYVMIGSIMFAEWEGWNYLDSTYFCVTSLCKIGIGDFVPGVNILEAKTGDKTKLIINFIYILLGMGLIAMCYKLMKEEVQIKVAYIKEDIRQCLHDIKMGIFSFIKNCFTCNF